jgi:hypothetical protein
MTATHGRGPVMMRMARPNAHAGGRRVGNHRDLAIPGRDADGNHLLPVLYPSAAPPTLRPHLHPGRGDAGDPVWMARDRVTDDVTVGGSPAPTVISTERTQPGCVALATATHASAVRRTCRQLRTAAGARDHAPVGQDYHLIKTGSARRYDHVRGPRHLRASRRARLDHRQLRRRGPDAPRSPLRRDAHPGLPWGSFARSRRAAPASAARAQ